MSEKSDTHTTRDLGSGTAGEPGTPTTPRAWEKLDTANPVTRAGSQRMLKEGGR
jgi:hypothetical protein